MRRISSTVLRPVAATLGAVALVSGLAFTSATAATPRGQVADPMAGAPAKGDCYAMTLKQASGDHEVGDPVGCARRHTSQIVGVLQLPARVTWDSSQDTILAAIGRGCENALTDAIGSNQKVRYRTQYGAFMFIPTDAEKDQGARWFSCHAAVTENDALGSLPKRLPKLRLPLPDSVAKCVTGLKQYVFTTCADRHNWRSTYTTYVNKRLTDRSLDRVSRQICPRHVSSRVWLRSALPLTRSKFVLACYTRTRR